MRFRRDEEDHMARTCAWVLVLAVAGFVHEARAQTVAEWHRGTTLSGFIGGASPASGTDVAAGAALGWELTPHFTLEGRGMWLEGGPGADAFAAVLGGRFPLLHARPVVPFASAGVGIYIASFDAESSGVPGFYQRRMARMMSGTGPFARQTFDDFAVALGGGADIFLARHLALRPDVTVLLVTTRSDTRVVPVYGLHLAYHFESHPVTPTRRPR
jgi:hypothetical protein